MKMTINDLLIQAMTMATKFPSVYNVEVDNNFDINEIQISFKNSVGARYCVKYECTLKGTTYFKTLTSVYCYNTDDLVSDRKYTSEELENYLKKVNI